MNKKAFTLAEMLITLGVIGIIAALTMPALVGHKPCENKINLLRAYNSLTRAVTDVASDETLYYGDDNDGLTDSRAPIGDIKQPYPADSLSDSMTANNKFSRLIASRLNINSDSYSNTALGSTFTTTDGIVWNVTNKLGGDSFVSVEITVPGDTSLKQNFKFNVDKYGGITPDSNIERNLIATPTELSVSEFKKVTGN